MYRYRIENININEFHIIAVSKVSVYRISVYRNFGMDNNYTVIVSKFRYIVPNFGIPLNDISKLNGISYVLKYLKAQAQETQLTFLV